MMAAGLSPATARKPLTNNVMSNAAGGLKRTRLCSIGARGCAAHTRPDRFDYRRSNSATRASNVTAANNA